MGGLAYRYVKTRYEFFVGFEEQDLDGQKAQIATVETALIDLVQLHRTAYTSDLVAEVLADSRHLLDHDRLNRYLEFANLTTQRIFDLLFERLSIDDDDQLLQRPQKAVASARPTPYSSTYNAKWWLYYDANLLASYSVVGNNP